MGTCLSKDKKGGTISAHTTHTSTASASSSIAKEKSVGSEPQTLSADPKEPTQECENPSSTTVARHSTEEASKEIVSTDKHVVEIRLPIASPNKFKTSPCSATLAAKAVAAIARPVAEDSCLETVSARSSDVEQEESEDRLPESTYITTNPSFPLFYSNYLSGASFSRDLAALSRDIASLTGSPLKRSPSANGAHDFVATAIKTAQFSPQFACHIKSYPDISNEDYYSNSRSRSLPKRFYGKGPQNAYQGGGPSPATLHKRSSSRDAVCINSMALSPRLAVRREEASGEYRVCARQAAARRSAASSFTQNSIVAPPISSKNKDRSPSSRRSNANAKSLGPCDADCTSVQEVLYFQENRTSSLHQSQLGHDMLRLRKALREKPTNCSAWLDDSSYGDNSSVKELKKAGLDSKPTNDVRKNVGLDGSVGGLYTETSQLDCSNPPLYCEGKPCLVDDNQSDDASTTYPASLQRVHSLIKALTEINTDPSLLSEVEESETEVESELELIRFALDANLSPRREIQAQQARNMRLKEAAMDAFARPSFHAGDVDAVDLGEKKQTPLGLSALMSMRLPDSETHSSRIREVLTLLSAAESKMGADQKTLFYNQLRTVLDSVRAHLIAKEKAHQDATEFANTMVAKAPTARANSWPRSVKEPPQIVMDVENSMAKSVSSNVNQDSSRGVIASTEGQEEVAINKVAKEQPFPTQCGASLGEEVTGEQTQMDCAYEVATGVPSTLQNLGCINFSGPSSMESLELNSPKSQYRNEDRSDVPDTMEMDHGSIETKSGSEVAKKVVVQTFNYSDEMDVASDFHIDMIQVVDIEGAGTYYVNPTTMEEVEAARHSTCMEAKEIYSSEKTKDSGIQGTSTINHGGLDPSESQESKRDVWPIEDPMHTSSGQYDEVDVVSFSECSSRKRVEDCKSDDVGSDCSFEFRLKSTVSTPLSTPSTPMLSTASTPRHITQTNPPLTAKAIVDIWEASINKSAL
ncbi:hypothetical protein KP509_06G086900 [Ceratopteris richardii]|uniref:Uncharacterized protein n=2 Tax=Ceratopteris richardii TaxID=49495 RepID=A0A8T2UIJ7_CERRI|nr:hypothetical protein KP509_06G086900 [Ceratopteris richardii]